MSTKPIEEEIEVEEVKEETEKKEKEGFVKKVKNGVNKKKAQFGEFIGKHPEFIVPMIAAGVTITKGIFGMVLGLGDNTENCKVEDDVTGLQYITTHPLTNQEILELSALKTQGETTGEALLDMEVLRKERKRK